MVNCWVHAGYKYSYWISYHTILYIYIQWVYKPTYNILQLGIWPCTASYWNRRSILGVFDFQTLLMWVYLKIIDAHFWRLNLALKWSGLSLDIWLLRVGHSFLFRATQVSVRSGLLHFSLCVGAGPQRFHLHLRTPWKCSLGLLLAFFSKTPQPWGKFCLHLLLGCLKRQAGSRRCSKLI